MLEWIAKPWGDKRNLSASLQGKKFRLSLHTLYVSNRKYKFAINQHGVDGFGGSRIFISDAVYTKATVQDAAEMKGRRLLRALEE